MHLQIDAFTDVPFAGNPAAVILLPPGAALPNSLRRQISADVHLAMTAFKEPLTDAGDSCAEADEHSVFASASR